jgi:integrase/recombinase XerD
MTPLFRSFLAADLAGFLAFKRDRGYRYTREAFTLRSFDRFVVEQKRNSRVSVTSLIADWLRRYPARRNARTVHWELGVMRQFCKFRQRRDPNAQIPDRWLAPPTTATRFIPHVFSQAEVRRLLDETDKLQRDKRLRVIGNASHRALTFRTLILVLYCTGLRLGEAVRLRLMDVDLKAGTFYIPDSKRKSRWVPFDADLGRALRRYLQARDVIGGQSPTSPVFVQPNGDGCQVQSASAVMRRLLRSAGLKPSRGRSGARPYDLRTTFAVHRLVRWYRSGVDLHCRLPWLSTYMGHDSLVGTQVYLKATFELLGHASRRFADHFWNRSNQNEAPPR